MILYISVSSVYKRIVDDILHTISFIYQINNSGPVQNPMVPQRSPLLDHYTVWLLIFVGLVSWFKELRLFCGFIFLWHAYSNHLVIQLKFNNLDKQRSWNPRKFEIHKNLNPYQLYGIYHLLPLAGICQLIVSSLIHVNVCPWV